MSDFYTIENRDLGTQLAPANTDRLLRKDIERRGSLPFSIGGGARKSGYTYLDYYSNGLFGTFTATVPLDLTITPLVMVWFIREEDKDKVVLSTASTPVGSDGIALTGGTAYSSYTKTTLTFTITTVNVGWSALIRSHFYYAVYYDEIKINELNTL